MHDDAYNTIYWRLISCQSVNIAIDERLRAVKHAQQFQLGLHRNAMQLLTS